MSVIRKVRKNPVTGQNEELTDSEYLILLLENLDKMFDIDVTIDTTTGKGIGKLKKKVS
jgi:hypothetical protein